jgi:hypothetical protein
MYTPCTYSCNPDVLKSLVISRKDLHKLQDESNSGTKAYLTSHSDVIHGELLNLNKNNSRK